MRIRIGLDCRKAFAVAIGLSVAGAAMAQDPKAQDLSRPVNVQTGLGSFRVPLGYFVGTGTRQDPRLTKGPGLAIAFWMPSGLPLKEPYIQKIGRPLYEGTPPTPEDFVFVVYYNPEEKLIEPLIQFGNVTSSSSQGLNDYRISQEDGLLRLFNKYTSPSGLIEYFGGRFVPEQQNGQSVFVTCWNQDRDAVDIHPVCGGTAQLDALSSRFNVEIPAAHVNQALSSVAMFFHLLTVWRSAPFSLNPWPYR